MRTVTLFLSAGLVMAGAVIAAQQQTSQTAPGAQPSAAGARPSGIVISGHVRRTNGEAIKKAIVTLQSVGGPNDAGRGRGNPTSAGGTRSILSDGEGAFSFTDVPPGMYRLRADRDGFIAMEYGQRSIAGQGIPISVQIGQKVSSIDFRLIQAAAIAGRIVDEDGQPVAGVQVQAMSYEYRQGQRLLQSASQVQTNDLGEYRLYWLQPGNYYVNAVLNPPGRGGRGAANISVPEDPSHPDESYAPFYFYPDSMDPVRAVAIEATAGADLRGVNFSLRPLKTGKVQGSVLPPVAEPPPSVQRQQQRQQQAQNNAQGGGRGGQRGGGPQGLAGVEIALLSPGAGSGGRGGIAGRGSVRADGTFEVTRVVPGTYNVAAFAERNSTDYTAMESVTVSSGGVSAVTLPLKPSVDVPGQVLLDDPLAASIVGQQGGGQNQQFTMTSVQVRMIPVDDFPGAGQENASARENGTFTVENIRALRYRVQVQLPAGAYLSSGTYGSVDALNGAIDVGDSVTQLQLRVGLASGRVEGTVVDRTGQPFAGATVALVPSMRTRLDLYRNVTSDGNGRFVIPNQAPGDYKVFAWEQIQQGAWQDPLVLEKFEDRGRAIHLDRSRAASEEIVVIPSTSN